MSRIKTRESVKDIKILDKAAVASERMKTALVRSKDQAENLMDDGQISPSEYAEDKIRYAAEDVTDQVWHEVSGQTKKAIEKGKEAHWEHRNEKRIRKKADALFCAESGENRAFRRRKSMIYFTKPVAKIEERCYNQT